MSHQRVGVDLHSGLVHAAAVTLSGGRPQVRELLHFRPGEAPGGLADFPRRIRFAVPDTEAQIKSISLPNDGSGELCDRIAFELTQSLLETDDRFAFDFHPVDDREHYLGLIYRRERLGALYEDYGIGDDSAVDLSRFVVRSLALGRGYLAFCRRTESTLVCLVYLAGDTVSICFVYGDKILDLASLTLGSQDLLAIADREQFAIDLKTVVSYRLTSIMEAGVSLPLSSLLLVGPQADSALCEALAEYFPVGVNRPEFHRGYFADDILAGDISLGQYLVALGLTVN